MAPGFGTTNVALAAGPTVVSTFFSHIATWPARHGSRGRNAESSSAAPTSLETLPGNQLRYEEGLRVVRRFLEFASHHGVEEVQSFTAQPVPIPRWVRREIVAIPDDIIDEAAILLTKQLATYGDGKGIDLVGGDKWWLVRGRPLEGEWIEMRKDYERRMAHKANKRKSWLTLESLRSKSGSNSIRDGSGADVKGDRVILYIHGGAFFFSSLDMHRYQIQRHARKAGARAFVPNYRLSPQYPFPCGLLDSLAAYLFLINPPPGAHAPIDPSSIIIMGDSAGGGMSLSLLVLIRELGLPMPAAASLVSPWVDLTHSMPSIMEWDGGDYIPSVGFHYRPSLVWPPLPGDGVAVKMPDGSEKIVEDQIQLYCPNSLLSHPLVSAINNGSLGGLCPLYISAGGAELLRDEVIYIAHKAANPTKYTPSASTLEEYPDQRPLIDKYPPTKVHLQVFEGACHVATTLAWTRSAKHIFRGTANNAAQERSKKSKEAGRADSAPPDRGEIDPLSSTPASRTASQNGPARANSAASAPPTQPAMGMTKVSSAAALTTEPETLPTPSGSEPSTRNPSTLDLHRLALSNNSPVSTDVDTELSSDDEGQLSTANMIQVRGDKPAWGAGSILAERVSTHGRITPMEPDHQVPALDSKLTWQIGRVRGDGPLVTWLSTRKEYDTKYAKDLEHFRSVRKADRAAAEKNGFLTRNLHGERIPLSALAGLHDTDMARKIGKSVDEPTHKTSVPVLVWMKMGEKADHEAVERSEDREKEMEDEEKERRKSIQKEERRKSAQLEHDRRKSIQKDERRPSWKRRSLEIFGRRSQEGKKREAE